MMKTTKKLILIIMSLFGFFKGADAKKAPKIEPLKSHLAFVLLDKAEFPTAEKLIETYSSTCNDNATLQAEIVKDSDREIITVTLPRTGTAFVALMDAKIPNNEAANHYDYSLASFSDPDAAPSHDAHLIVTTVGRVEGISPLDSLQEFTTLLAAILKATNSTGVYWGNAGATHPKELFLSITSECDVSPRIVAWNGFSRGQETEHTMSFLSRGMYQLGLPELYLIFPTEEATDAIGRFFDLLAYVAGRGEAIPAGDTIGVNENERIKVTYVKSPAGDKSLVWKVDLTQK